MTFEKLCVLDIFQKVQSRFTKLSLIRFIWCFQRFRKLKYS